MAVAATTLSAAIASAGATSCTVRDAVGFASTADSSDLVLCGSELMLVTAGMGTTSWTVTRGYASTTAVAHLDAATVYHVERGWTSLVDAKAWTSVTDAVDDANLLTAIEATNAFVTGEVGLFLGPSTDALRLFDGCSAVRGGTRLYVPGGIRTLTAVRVATTSGGSLAAATLSDYLLRPKSWELRTGQPYSWVDINPAGTVRSFPTGTDDTELTGTFGYAAAEARGAQIARTVVSRMWLHRNDGALANPTPSKFVYADDAAILRELRAEHFAAVR